MKRWAVDLHIHTALSPCAAEEMTPPAIVQAACARGLAMIAICDHNATGNTAATMAASRGAGEAVAVLAGIEITTAEEVHVVGFFPDATAAAAVGAAVRATLPPIDDSYTARFGAQRLMDENGCVVGFEDCMLAMASTLDLSATVDLIHRHGGVAVAAHINRPSFSVLSQLGVFPSEAGFDAIEVFSPCDGAPPVARGSVNTSEYGLSVLASSDSHFLAEIGRCRTLLDMEAPSFDELVLALHRARGRQVVHA